MTLAHTGETGYPPLDRAIARLGEDDPVRELVAAWLTGVATRRGVRTTTLGAYARDLGDWSDWCRANRLLHQPIDARLHAWRNWLLSADGGRAEWAWNTIRCRLRTLGLFAESCPGVGPLPPVPTDRLHLTAPAVTAPEAVQLLQQTDVGTWIGSRDRLIIVLLLDGSLGREAIAALQVGVMPAAVDRDWIGGALADWLKWRALRPVRSGTGAEQALLHNHHRGRLHIGGIDRAVARARRAADLEERVTTGALITSGKYRRTHGHLPLSHRIDLSATATATRGVASGARPSAATTSGAVNVDRPAS